MEHDYRYYAFISYSHKDAKWAKWIHGALEHYRLPAVMRKAEKNGYPKKIAPVFIDSADLGSGVLAKKLPKELEDSRSLVVLCSPNSAKPNDQGINWIDLEVSHFCDIGRTDKIVPVIVEGSPGESFCPRLKKEGILALDATKQKRKRLLNDIVAALLGLRPDDLWKREKRRQRQRWTCGLLAGSLFMLLSACGIMRYQDEYCDHVEYYADYVNDWGVPRGVRQLTEHEICHRASHYRFVYKGYANLGGGARNRILRSVRRCDSSGRTVDGFESAWFIRPAVQYLYYDNHNLARKTCFDADGRELYSLVLSDTGVWSASGVNFDAKNWIWGGEVFGWNYVLELLDMSSLQKGQVSRLLPELKLNASAKCFYLSGYNPEGFPARIDFLPNNQSRKAMSNALGAYGEQYAYDDSGRLACVRFIDSDGNPFTKTNVFAGIDIEYCANTTTVVSVDSNQIPIANNKGWICRRLIFSENGNVIESSYLNRQRELCDGPDGIAKTVYEYDRSCAFRTRCLRYSALGELIPASIGWAIEERKYRQGRIDVFYKNAAGNEFVTQEGYSHFSREWQGDSCTTRFFIGDATPVLNNKTLIHQEVLRTVRDESDGSYMEERTTFGINLEPKQTWDGYSNVVYRVGTHGCEYVKMRPAIMGKVAEVKIDRELGFGKVVKSTLRFLDADGNPAAPSYNTEPTLKGVVNQNKANCDMLEFELDEYGRVKLLRGLGRGALIATTKISYGENGLISLFASDAGGAAIEYGDVGVSGMTLLGPDMMSTNFSNSEVSRVAFVYDDYGRQKWIRFFSASGELRVWKHLGVNIAALHCEYAPNGDLILEEGFDEHMNLVNCQKYIYERRGGITSTSVLLFGKDGETPIENEAGYHKQVVTKNSVGQLLEISFYRLDGQTLALNESGFARMKVCFNEGMRISGVKYFDEDDNLLVEIKTDNAREFVPMVRFRLVNLFGLKDGDVLVAVNGRLCLGNPELAESLTRDNASCDLVVSRPGTDGRVQFVSVRTPPGDSVVIYPEVVPASPQVFEIIYNQYLQQNCMPNARQRKFSFQRVGFGSTADYGQGF